MIRHALEHKGHPLTQKIEAPNADDSSHIEKQRSWVRNHFDEAARHRYETVEGKLRLLSTIIRANWIARNETYKLQCLGITFGDALAQQMGLDWVAVEDKLGRDPALRDPQTGTLVFPLTSISKRVEQGQAVEVVDLFIAACDKIEELRRRAAK